MTDEQLVHLFLASEERLAHEARRLWEDAVEAARLGTVFASNLKAYRSWSRSRRSVRRPAPLSDAALERALMNVAAMFPRNVTRATVA